MKRAYTGDRTDPHVSYSLKKKCQGCIALRSSATGYRCSLGITVVHDWLQPVDGTCKALPVRPRPTKKCYKPKDVLDLKKAKELIAIDKQTGRRGEA